MIEFVLATANPDKAREIEAILGNSVRLLPRPPGIPDVEETGQTLEENALIKARALVLATGLPAIADDTGLEVEDLAGAPGVRSARYAGEGATYEQNVEKLLRELSAVAEPRRARFRTVAAACWPDGLEIVAEGWVDGAIGTARRGGSGFGYDPVFVPAAGDGRTFAEMTPDEKNRLSHRGRAFRALGEKLPKELQEGAEAGALRSEREVLVKENHELQEALVKERDATRTLQAELISVSRRLSEVEVLETQLQAIQQNVFWRASAPLRRLATRLPAPARRRMKNAARMLKPRVGTAGRRAASEDPGRRPQAVPPVASAVDDHTIGPLPVFPSPSATRFVNLVTDTLVGRSVWEGARASVLVAGYLAERIGGRLRVISRDRSGDPADVVALLRDSGFGPALEVETLWVGPRSGTAVPVSRDDRFVTASWSQTVSTTAAVGFARTAFVMTSGSKAGQVVAGTSLRDLVPRGPGALLEHVEGGSRFDPPFGASLVGATGTSGDGDAPVVLVCCEPGVNGDLRPGLVAAMDALGSKLRGDGWRIVVLGPASDDLLDGLERLDGETMGWRNYAATIRGVAVGVVLTGRAEPSLVLSDLVSTGARVVSDSSLAATDVTHGSGAVIPVSGAGDLTSGLEEAVRLFERHGRSGSVDAPTVDGAWRNALVPIADKMV